MKSSRPSTPFSGFDKWWPRKIGILPGTSPSPVATAGSPTRSRPDGIEQVLWPDHCVQALSGRIFTRHWISPRSISSSARATTLDRFLFHLPGERPEDLDRPALLPAGVGDRESLLLRTGDGLLCLFQRPGRPAMGFQATVLLASAGASMCRRETRPHPSGMRDKGLALSENLHCETSSPGERGALAPIVPADVNGEAPHSCNFRVASRRRSKAGEIRTS